MDKKVMGQSHPEGSGQCFRIPVDINDTCCHSGFNIGTSVL